VVADLARKHPAWGHRKIWAMARHGGHQLTMSTVLRVLRDEGLLLEASYQRERRRLAEERKAAFCDPPTGPNQVWQFDFSEYETAPGGPPGSRTTGRSMSSVGIGPRQLTSTTRSPAWS
jgi:putative transposase